MALTAAIKFTQGPNTDLFGRALFGTLTDGPVVCTSQVTGGVTSYVWELTDVPPGSALALGVFSTSSSGSFGTPLTRGGYLVDLTVSNGIDTLTVRLAFVIKEASGRWIAPFKAPDTALTFGGSLRGWSNSMEPWLHRIDEIVQPIVDAVVDPAAAIQGTKISPNFGAQNIRTSGALSLGANPPTVGTIRLSHLSTIYGRIGATDQLLLDWGNVNPTCLTIGDAVTPFSIYMIGAQLQLTTVSGTYVQFRTTDIVLSYSLMQWVTGSVEFKVNLNGNPNQTGGFFRISGQTMIGTGSTGGSLELSSGAGVVGPGTLQLKTGTTVVAQFQRLTSDYVALGPLSASQGYVRLPTSSGSGASTIMSRNWDNSDDLAVYSSSPFVDGQDTQVFGSIATAGTRYAGGGLLDVQIANGMKMRLSGSTAQFTSINIVLGDFAVDGFITYPANSLSTAGTGKSLLIKGQQWAGGTGVTVAGSVGLIGGLNTSATGTRTGGGVFLQPGTGATANGAGNLFRGNGGAAFAWSDTVTTVGDGTTTMIYNAASPPSPYHKFQVGGVDVFTIGTGSYVFGLPDVTFTTPSSDVTISMGAVSAAGALNSLYLRGRNGNGSGTYTGGSIVVQAGNGLTGSGTGGDAYVLGGQGVVKGGNVILCGFPAGGGQAMQGGVRVKEALAAPTSNPANDEFLLYQDPADHRVKIRNSLGVFNLT